MITEQDLREAIAECEGQKKPGANTCLKLAAFYSIKDHLYPDNIRAETAYQQQPRPAYTAAGNSAYYDGDMPERVVEYQSISDFGQAINGKKATDIWGIMDELMDALIALNPRLYDSVMRKIK